MKKVVPILLLLFVFLSGCKKEEVEPDNSAVVEGSYPITYLATGGWSLSLPKDGVNGTVTFRRISSTLTNMRIYLVSNGKTLVDQSINAYLSGQGTVVDMYSDDKRQTRAGYGTKSYLDVTIANPDGSNIAVKASR